MNNYDKMNETGQSSLVQYSDYLADKPENLNTHNNKKILSAFYKNLCFLFFLLIFFCQRCILYTVVILLLLIVSPWQ